MLGLSWLFAVANVFYRDVEHLLAVVFLPWFFLTPVLYSLDQFSAADSHRWLILLMRYGNPVTPYVESVRAVVLQHVVPGASLLAVRLPRRTCSLRSLASGWCSATRTDSRSSSE